MRSYLASLLVMTSLGVARPIAPTPHAYLFVWAGDSAQKSNDFLAVIDADSKSPTYGKVLRSVATGAAGMPHHTEHQLSADDHLLANDFYLGRTWLFDLTDALRPKLLSSFADVAGFSHPHSFIRLANGEVLATFQYRADRSNRPLPMKMGSMATMSLGGKHVTGGLVRMNERGQPSRAVSAADPTIGDRRIYPYSVLPIAQIDRAVSTTTDMDEADSAATSQWVQIWRLSDLKLLKTIALPAGPRGDENRYTGEPRLLPDGRSVYVHTFNCGLYLLRNVAGSVPTSMLVYRFQGTECGVPILAGHYWLQTVPDAHALIALDISDAEHPREVSRVSLGASEHPHWIAIDPTGARVVLNSAARGTRLFMIDFDHNTGRLTLDTRFHGAGSTQPGVSMSGRSWPHGFTGTAIPHGTVFSN